MNELALTFTTDTLGTSVSTLNPKTKDEQKMLYNAISNSANKVQDFINMEIELKDVYMEVIEVTNEESGEVSIAPRIVLISTDGTSYSCVSIGVYGSLQKLFAVFGHPSDWDEPMTVIPRQISTKKGKTLTLEVC